MKKDSTRRKGRFVFWLWALCGFFAWGCDDSPPPQKPGAGGGAGDGKGAVQAVAELADPTAVQPSYVYSPIGKRDPFKSFYKEIVKDEEEIPGGVLQRYEIDQLKLTAIISGISRPVAQVSLPDGVGVNMTIGTPVGKHQGKVVRIKNDEVIVAEDYRDYMGRKVTNYITLKLHKDQEKGR